jgi:hypothetical protein
VKFKNTTIHPAVVIAAVVIIVIIAVVIGVHYGNGAGSYYGGKTQVPKLPPGWGPAATQRRVPAMPVTR